MAKFQYRFSMPDYIDPDEMTTGALNFDPETCKRCGICARICPGRTILMEKRKGEEAEKPFPRLDEIVPGLTLCIACGCCLAACPEEAISIKRNFMGGLFYLRLTQGTKMTFPRPY